MIAPKFRKQVELLLDVLPFIAQEEVFALKGGTAINLFDRNMPRLSVDIDLVYTKLNDRRIALQDITAALKRIKEQIEGNLLEVRTQLRKQGQGSEVKLICNTPEAEIKIEVNTIIRGHVFPLRRCDITDIAEEEFERFVSMHILSREELYGGKICAALDRQHPRDLFDIFHLLRDGLTDDIRAGFILMLLSHPRPMHELLSPNMHDMYEVFTKQFTGMSTFPFSYAMFESTRKQLVDSLSKTLTKTEKAFLLSFKTGIPDWKLFPISGIDKLPAIQWKLLNIKKLKELNPLKHRAMTDALYNALDYQSSSLSSSSASLS
ncbi:nucleotidyl transferase AbiEii/AbiGii toxin family protein [Prosthecochloris vibrioformis]|uniref:Nucleotidyl transferase AbiEii/AbiGii toxin family protein n=1 Tax=Prosthecochloris vibrioformis TaxID=1098 RepID=A0A5C4S066_PROVB|nr:nucleotidyl transferase AbiEii/AbiGii toxin family protein [Prosthecochloris vibrioformis]TNJ36625.1 nucleotidyl transferase AbiEii/AbiGii toxin family protein [Prosthecochloris vibrioformis]